MKKCLLLFVTYCIALSSTAQLLTGQWHGKFWDMSLGSNKIESVKYVLDLQQNGKRVTGTSYTYFTDEGSNYYSICTVAGEYDYAQKKLVFAETKRIKTNYPGNAEGLQIHHLNFTNGTGVDVLMGDWKDAYSAGSLTSFGKTELSRKKQTNTLPQLQALAIAKKKTTAVKPERKLAALHKPKFSTTVASTTITQTTSLNNRSVATLSANDQRSSLGVEILADPIQEIDHSVTAKLVTRKKKLLQTITTKSKIIKIAFYDNGEIDGDSISVFFNEQMILEKQRLRDKAISFILELSALATASNELVMYAENLGTIPPNTALMIVTDGDKRYEVRITSDLESSGAIKFAMVD